MTFNLNNKEYDTDHLTNPLRQTLIGMIQVKIEQLSLKQIEFADNPEFITITQKSIDHYDEVLRCLRGVENSV